MSLSMSNDHVIIIVVFTFVLLCFNSMFQMIASSLELCKPCVECASVCVESFRNINCLDSNIGLWIQSMLIVYALSNPILFSMTTPFIQLFNETAQPEKTLAFQLYPAYNSSTQQIYLDPQKTYGAAVDSVIFCLPF